MVPADFSLMANLMYLYALFIVAGKQSVTAVLVSFYLASSYRKLPTAPLLWKLDLMWMMTALAAVLVCAVLSVMTMLSMPV
jgi:hypothetical protein